MRIGELAARTGKSVPALRYHEELGLLKPPERTEGGYRDYPIDAVDRVLFIIRAQERGFSLKEIKAVFTLADRGTAPCESVAKAVSRKITRMDMRMAQLRERRAILAETLRRFESGEMAEASFCSLLNVSEAQERKTEMARKVKVFTAGCPLCEPVVEMVQRIACANCDVTVLNLNDAKGAGRAKEARVDRVPFILVDGKPASCCASGGPVTESALRAAGIGAG